jgi:hypothetical protein
MAKYKILKDAPGSQDGLRVIQFKKGEVVELTAHLAPIFVADGVAELASEEKALKGAPENKSKGKKDDGEE